MLLEDVERALVRGPLRLEERRLLRGLGRMQSYVPLQSAEKVPLRRDERVPARGPVIGMERGHERTLFFGPERRPLRVVERGLHKGLEFPLWSGGWSSEDG
jgi:hypothetical protein